MIDSLIHPSPTWKTSHPGASLGILVLEGVSNPLVCPALEAEKIALTARLRERFGGQDRSALSALPAIQAYNAYLKPFNKTYHVLLQLESVALKGKPIPQQAALVEAMFMAELENQLLTAGHDLDALTLPLTLATANGAETYIRLNGQEQTLKCGDMFIADRTGIISSIVYGPDRRTCITSATRSAIFTIYAPPGIDREMLFNHLKTIQRYALMISPEARTGFSGIIPE